MRIVFFCGSIEPGRDGVGDYTQRLAEQLSLTGHICSIIALNDSHISVIEDKILLLGNTSINTLRFPSITIAYNSKQVIKQWLHKFNATIVSLQFVPFAFHPKGLPFQLTPFLLHLVADKPLHIMFHELWVGMSKHSIVKEKCWGLVQRQLIKSMVKRLKPSVVHTQTDLYQKQLDTLSVKAKLLPLFGNIRPVIENVLNDKSINNTKEISLVIFGAIHPDSPFAAFAKDAKNFAVRQNLLLKLIFIGRCGALQQQFIETWKKHGLEYFVYGEQSVEVISEVLLNATIGLTTTPLLLIQKSGTVAAMLEHGLPVICLAKAWSTSFKTNFSIPQNIFSYTNQSNNIEECLLATGNISNSYINSVSYVANQFVKDIPALQQQQQQTKSKIYNVL